jgi:hypothetical protein
MVTAWLQKTLMSGALLLAVLGTDRLASAGVTPDVEKKFRGEIVVSDQSLAYATSDEPSAAIDVVIKARKKVLRGREIDGVRTWTFHYTAFLNSPLRTKDLSLDFHKTDRAATYAASKGFEAPGQLKILSGSITITEDDNIDPNQTYRLVLRERKGGKERDVATTTLRFE